MAGMQKIINGIDGISERIGKWSSWLTAVLVILVCFDVIIRYIFSDSSAWIMELEWHFFSLIFLLGAAYAFKNDRHVRVDLFYAKFGLRDKAWVNILGNLLFLIPWCVIIMIYSFDYAMTSYQIGETSPDPGGLPARYIIKFSITIGVFFLFLQAIGEILRSYLELTQASSKSSE